jgi:hypothetical protein
LNKERKIGVASLAMIGPCPPAWGYAHVTSIQIRSKAITLFMIKPLHGFAKEIKCSTFCRSKYMEIAYTNYSTINTKKTTQNMTMWPTYKDRTKTNQQQPCQSNSCSLPGCTVTRNGLHIAYRHKWLPLLLLCLWIQNTCFIWFICSSSLSASVNKPSFHKEETTV